MLTSSDTEPRRRQIHAEVMRDLLKACTTAFAMPEWMPNPLTGPSGYPNWSADLCDILHAIDKAETWEADRAGSVDAFNLPLKGALGESQELLVRPRRQQR